MAFFGPKKGLIRVFFQLKIPEIYPTKNSGMGGYGYIPIPRKMGIG